MTNDTTDNFMGDDKNPPNLTFSEDREEAIKQVWRLGVLHGKNEALREQVEKTKARIEALKEANNGE